MGMTITEKIMAAHAGKTHVEPGELIYCRLDGVLGNDITTPVAINEFDKLKLNSVFDQDKVFLVMDHFAPNKDIKSAMQIQGVREFAQKFGVTNYFEGGQVGIEHCLLPEAGLVLPGDIIIGADSHTCTYGALALSRLASAVRTWRPAWLPANAGLRCRNPLSLFILANCHPG